MFIWPLFLKISQDTDSPSYPGKAIRYTGGKKCFKIKKLHDEEPAVTEDHHLWLQIKWNWFPLSRDSSGWWSIMCKQLANSLPASQGCMKKEVGWGKPRMENDISTTDLNYLSPSQKAWLRSHLWISYVACWIEHHWRKKKREREREDALFFPPRFQSKDTPSPDLKKMYIYVSFISLLLLSSWLYQDNSNTVGWAIHCHKQHGRSHMMGLFQVWIRVQVWSSKK